ncbi:MAG: ABC transporter permease [Nanoarchaeota archaeon]|nr:ABC transporter permease [Nanoarchaeota archaeon]
MSDSSSSGEGRSEMLVDLLKLSWAGIKHRRLRSWLTMIGIFIGIAAVVSLVGLGEGLRVAITSQFGFLGTDSLTVTAVSPGFGPPGQGAVNPLKDDLMKKIESIQGVNTAYARIVESALLEYNDNQRMSYVGSVPEGHDRKSFETMLNLNIETGRLLRDSDKAKVVLGNRYSTEDIFGKPVEVGKEVLINGEPFIVIGILEKKGSFIVDGSILMNEQDAKELYNDDKTVDLIIVKVESEALVPQVQENVEKLLRKERGVKVGEEDFQVQTPAKALESLNQTLFAIQLFVYIIATISLVVGGIGIMNTMYTAVLERTREIGIMKAIGARNSMIFLLFFLESGFIGLVGGIIGTGLGFSLSHGLAFLARQAGFRLIQASVSPLLIFGSLAFSFSLGTIFGVLPALRAAKMQPVEALRG